MTPQRKVTLAALLFGLVGIAALTHFTKNPSSINFLQEQSVSAEEAEVMRAYVNFIAEYGKSYATKDHANQKYEVFKKNYETIKVFNKHESQVPFVLSVNQFADLSPEEFASLNKVEIPQALQSLTSNSRVEAEREHSHLPHVHSEEHFKGEHKHVTRINKKKQVSASYDDSEESDDYDETDSVESDDEEDQYYEQEFEKDYEREYQKNREHHRHDRERHNDTKRDNTTTSDTYINWFERGAVSVPKDQQSCGSCWAFTTAATLESLAVISGFADKVPDYSMQQLVDCDRANDGCDGGWMYKAYNYTATYGLMEYGEYPYTQREGKCLHRVEGNGTKRFRNKGMVQETDLSNRKLKAIVARQPVGVGIYTNAKFQFYKGGVMTEEFLGCSDPKNAVNHGVTVVGYGSTKGDQKTEDWCSEYWIVRNSWGAKWGEAGFFRLCMDDAGDDYVPYGICQLNRYPTYPTMGDTKVQEELFM